MKSPVSQCDRRAASRAVRPYCCLRKKIQTLRWVLSSRKDKTRHTAPPMNERMTLTRRLRPCFFSAPLSKELIALVVSKSIVRRRLYISQHCHIMAPRQQPQHTQISNNRSITASFLPPRYILTIRYLSDETRQIRRSPYHIAGGPWKDSLHLPVGKKKNDLPTHLFS